MKSIVIDYRYSTYVKIAGYVIRIDFHECNSSSMFMSVKNRVLEICKGFIVRKREKVDATIFFAQNNQIPYIIKGPHIYFQMIKENPHNAYSTTYGVSDLQIIFLLRFILSKLLQKNGFFMHCSASLVHNEAVLFTGNSGAGKSTISQFMSVEYPILADDSAIIKKEGKKYYFYHLPTVEKDIVHINKNINKYLISNIFFLKKRGQFVIEEGKNIGDITNRLINQTWTQSHAPKHMVPIILHFINGVKRFYFLSFPKNKVIVHHKMSSFLLKRCT